MMRERWREIGCHVASLKGNRPDALAVKELCRPAEQIR
jgi:hypothetical protein